uniref:response regulator n=1 Tax=Anaerosporobacter sp. TaxID=1872529 RepID=UPI00286F9D74
MNIIAVDDERILLEDLAKAIKVAIPECMLSCFKKPSEALKYAQDIKIDVAFLDIEMGGMNGLVLAKKLKDIYPKINIVFTTGYSHYALESYKVNASDYLLKPVKPEMIKNALENLRNPVERINQNKIRVQCFGNFEVFANDEPLQFSRSKTKELLAYLVLRQGAICTNNEISAVLWEDGVKTPSTKDYFRQLVSDLT